jgi:hypothetical protein
MRREAIPFVLAIGLFLVMAGVAMRFPAEVVGLISWVEEWFDQE